MSAERGKSGHVPISLVPLLKLCPSPENEELYRPVQDDDPEVIALAESIRERGLQEPLVITQDDYIVSGHRRRVAAWMAGLREVPCRRLMIYREGNPA
jgi:ParB-like chromosome segregation protein Spo0J